MTNSYQYTPCPRCGTITHTNTCNCQPYRVTFTGEALITSPQDIHAYSPDHAAEKACTQYDRGTTPPQRPLSTYGKVMARVVGGDQSPVGYTIELRRMGGISFYQANKASAPLPVAGKQLNLFNL